MTPSERAELDALRAMRKRVLDECDRQEDVNAYAEYGPSVDTNEIRDLLEFQAPVEPEVESGWDWGDPEPEEVTSLLDYTGAPSTYDEDSPQWGRTTGGEWKGYKNGDGVYLAWPELTRRWGPLTEREGQS